MKEVKDVIYEAIHHLRDMKLGAADARMVVRAIAHLEDANAIINGMCKRKEKADDTSATVGRVAAEA